MLNRNAVTQSKRNCRRIDTQNFTKFTYPFVNAYYYLQTSSATINFWDEWNKGKTEKGFEQAVEALRRQQK